MICYLSFLWFFGIYCCNLFVLLLLSNSIHFLQIALLKVLKCPIHHKLEHIFIKRRTSYCSCKKNCNSKNLCSICYNHNPLQQEASCQFKKTIFFPSDKIVLQRNGRTVFKSIGSDCALLQRVRIRSKTSLFDFWVSNEHQERRLE